jgi:hypothetical protein
MTFTVTVPELFARFGSSVVEVIAAVLVIVEPSGALDNTCRTRVNVADAPAGSTVRLQATVPVVPLVGSVHANPGPAVCDREIKIVFVGVTSVSETFSASLGPLFVTVNR